MPEKTCCVCRQPVNTERVYDLRQDRILHPECVSSYVYRAMKKTARGSGSL